MALSAATVKRTTLEYFTNYFDEVARFQRRQQIEISMPGTLLFPSMLVVTDANSHFVAELVGARRLNGRLLVKAHHASNLQEHISQFTNVDHVRHFAIMPYDLSTGYDRVGFKGLAIAFSKTQQHLRARFPGLLDRFDSRLSINNVSPDQDALALMTPSNTGVMLIEDCLLANQIAGVVRVRVVNVMVIVPKSWTEHGYKAYLAEQFPLRPGGQLGGLTLARSGENHEAIVVGGQLANLILQGASEVTLTSFLEQHDDVVRNAFGASRVIYQPVFRWLVGNPEPSEVSIQPDLLMKVGTQWQVGDFKLPLLKRKKVTKGGHRRRRFVDSVGEGIAQLYNYHEFFSFAENRAQAALQVHEDIVDPALTLVVGSNENVKADEVREAARSIKPVDILDWDTVIQLYIARTKPSGHV